MAPTATLPVRRQCAHTNHSNQQKRTDMKFLTKEVKIALTAITAAVLVFIGVNFLKGINIFQSSNTYYVKFKNVG